ncbi:hypothetical protein Smp_185320 [Schistosoma mansoni]|uniref:hypothetical protein n=1 Tax=Schistosoma mansoni TaxID=6183 RepID=UPI00022DC73A|nr:hypothetical protein Smp_185320 [Schistosoma mansoni]|eukprot:XP_018648787.1 hypothetical protein Smp_185320 [Schistosoma mansoni]
MESMIQSACDLAETYVSPFLLRFICWVSFSSMRIWNCSSRFSWRSRKASNWSKVIDILIN